MWDLVKAQLLGSSKNAPAGEGNGIVVRGTTPLVSAQVVRPSDATQYSIGDNIANSQTAASVVPITFTVTPRAGGSGRITGARCVVTAASGTIVLPAFDLLLFRPGTNLPFAVAGYPADNAALNITAAAMREMVGVLPFSASSWRNQAGGVTAAGAQIWQDASFTSRPFVGFNLASLSPAVTLLGLLQAQNTWNPGVVVQTIDITLDADVD